MPAQQRTSLDYVDYDGFSKEILAVVRTVPLITVLFSGRPLLVQSQIASSEAFIAAFLPGTSGGEAVISAIFGNYLFG
jgi:beta-glucosidase